MALGSTLGNERGGEKGGRERGFYERSNKAFSHAEQKIGKTKDEKNNKGRRDIWF
jgi:hypothetical protein